MLSYQHGYHAGNRADVLKHAVLHGVLQAEAETNTPLLYVETHAARGVYDLTEKQGKPFIDALPHRLRSCIVGLNSLSDLRIPSVRRDDHAAQN